MKFGHIGLTVASLSRSKAFYEKLGFKERLHIRRSRAPWLDSRVGVKDLDIEFTHMENENGVKIELLKYHSPKCLPSWAEPPAPGHSHFSLVVDDASKYGLLDNQDTAIPDGPQKGMRGFYMRDPDGHTIEIMEEASGLTTELSEIIDEIQEIRSRNNVLHCDLIRLCYRVAPDETRKVFRQIEANDEKITALGKKSAAL